ncbi:HEAT repeat domain-containing protein [Ruania zhangjianzhongii]|uniref:HEAT repeat domain-containing protein n=1 Tax=Ruania zhangjianzhongii TaxID=2603206 RepID=UPI0011C8864D|nr:HEAT repeat domain-containing protein [Ruania zhangjianzhongii]
MNTPHTDIVNRHVTALSDPRSSIRLRAAMAIGTEPADELVPALIERCALEPDFYVRDMLTWSLTRHRAAVVVPRLLAELESTVPQARSQALHTLSKIGDQATWPALTAALLQDGDPEVARSAWRAAVAIVPAGSEPELAALLAGQLGRGDVETQRSLSRALVALGEVILPQLHLAARGDRAEVRAHALATERLLQDPDAAFTLDVDEAIRIMALNREDEREC